MIMNIRVKTKLNINKIMPYLLVSPAILLMVFIVIYPIFKSIFMSFHYYVIWDLKNLKFIGFDNYLKALNDVAFIASARNTVVWVTMAVSFQLFFGFILAMLLNLNFKGRGIVRSISLIPWVTPGVIIALMWTWIFDGNYGVLNDILLKAGIINQKVPWLSQTSTSLSSVIVAIVWQGIPFFTIMILASLQSISEQLYEAAAVDGASPFQKFKGITVPHLMPTILITTLLRIIWISNNVDLIYIMTGGGPAYSSRTLSVYAFIEAYKTYNFGYGATVSIYWAIILCFVLMIYFKISKWLGGEEIK
jgi:multiple sugar transport system permease protein